MLVGRYAGERQLLSAERDVSVRTVDAETRHLSQTSLVMGNVLIQVFADPWRDAPPELTENAVQPFIALIGANRRGVKWPPPTSIDDSLYDVMRLGAGAPAPQGRTDVQEGRQIFMANHNGAQGGPAASTLDAVEPAAAPLVLDAPPAEPDTPLGEPDLPPPSTDEPRVTTTEAPPDEVPPTTHRRRRAYVALALVVVLVLGGFGMYERSSANRSRAKVASLEQQAQALNAQFQVKAQQLRSSESRAAATRRSRVGALGEQDGARRRTGPAAPDRRRDPAGHGRAPAVRRRRAPDGLERPRRGGEARQQRGAPERVGNVGRDRVPTRERRSRPARRAVGSRQAVTTGAGRGQRRGRYTDSARRLRSSWRRVSAGVTAPVCNGIALRLCSSNAPPAATAQRPKKIT